MVVVVVRSEAKTWQEKETKIRVSKGDAIIIF